MMDRGESRPSCNDDIRITNEDAPRDTGTRNFSDVLIVQSTLPGYVSYRDRVYGSWLIQALCNVFMTMAWSLPIRDLFDKVSTRVKYLYSLYFDHSVMTFIIYRWMN